MDIKEFVSQTLKQIEDAIKGASSDDMEYYLDSHSSKGVHFNLAVTNTETSEETGKKGGGVKIKVIEASVGKDNKTMVTSENVSRIEFNVKNVDHAKQKAQIEQMNNNY